MLRFSFCPTSMKNSPSTWLGVRVRVRVRLRVRLRGRVRVRVRVRNRVRVSEHLPDARPHEPHARHVVVCDLDDLLQRVDLRVRAVGELLACDGAEVRDELYDGVGAQLRLGLGLGLGLG